MKMSSELLSNGDQPLYENFRKVLLCESLPSLIVSYQLNIGQLEHLRHLLDVLEHLGGKSNLKKMFTVMLWETSQSPTLCFLSVQFPKYTGLLNGIYLYSLFPSANALTSEVLEGLFRLCRSTFIQQSAELRCCILQTYFEPQLCWNGKWSLVMLNCRRWFLVIVCLNASCSFLDYETLH